MGSDWFGDDFFDSVRGQIRANVGTAAEALCQDIKQNIGIQGKPFDRRSYVGEFPRKETGTLQESIRVVGPTEEADVITAQVGTDLGYGQELEEEMGRPFLARTLRENEEQYARMILGSEE